MKTLIGTLITMMLSVPAFANVTSECSSGAMTVRITVPNAGDSTFALIEKLFISGREIALTTDPGCRGQSLNDFGCHYKGDKRGETYFVTVDLGADHVITAAHFSVWTENGMTEHLDLQDCKLSVD